MKFSSSSLITPSSLGFKSKFDSFRSNQIPILMSLLSSPARFLFLKAPPGIGKTLIYTSYALIRDGRSLFLTSTKSHGDLLLSDMAQIGMVGIEGHSNYPCYNPSSSSSYCQFETCSYSRQCFICQKSDYVQTNYHHEISLSLQGLNNKLGSFKTLICDEAHRVHDILCSAVEIRFRSRFLDKNFSSHPKSSDSISTWISWAKSKRDLERSDLFGDKEEINEFSRSIDILGSIGPASQSNWLNLSNQSTNKSSIIFSPIWGRDFAEQYLFQSIDKVLLVSATINKGHQKLLNIPDSECEWFEVDSPFKVENRPFIFIADSPKIRVNFRISENDSRRIIHRIDSLISLYPNQKGLIHSRTYRWQGEVKTKSGFTEVLVCNQNSSDLDDCFEIHRNSQNQSLLCSPSIWEGFDFPGPLAVFQIILKVPYLDKHNSAILAARCKQNPDYEIWEVVGALTQMYGRIYRSHSCYGETFILDAGWLDFIDKHSHRFDRYFRLAWDQKRIDQVNPLWRSRINRVKFGKKR